MKIILSKRKKLMQMVPEIKDFIKPPYKGFVDPECIRIRTVEKHIFFFDVAYIYLNGITVMDKDFMPIATQIAEKLGIILEDDT